jgi:hypothetical protein
VVRPEGNRPLGRQSVDGKIKTKWIFERRLDCSGSGQGHVAGACECGNESSGFIKCGVFIDYVRAC